MYKGIPVTYFATFRSFFRGAEAAVKLRRRVVPQKEADGCSSVGIRPASRLGKNKNVVSDGIQSTYSRHQGSWSKVKMCF